MKSSLKQFNSFRMEPNWSPPTWTWRTWIPRATKYPLVARSLPVLNWWHAPRRSSVVNPRHWSCGTPNESLDWVVWRHALLVIAWIQSKSEFYLSFIDMESWTFMALLSSIVAGISSEIDPVLVLSGVTSMQDLSLFAYRPYLILRGVYEIPTEDDKHAISESDMEAASRRVSSGTPLLGLLFVRVSNHVHTGFISLSVWFYRIQIWG